MAEADDVPPLEDMSEMLHQVEQLREQREKKKKNPQHNGTSHTQNGSNVNITEVKQHSNKTTAVSEQKDKAAAKSGGENKGGFGGMRKGFLFGGTSSKSTPKKSTAVNKKETKTDSDDLTFIKKDEKESSAQFQFPEVEKAMSQTSSLLDNKEWVTDELLENVQKNERLTRSLQDPAFARALAEFQTNPQAAAIKYQNNPEFQETFKDFCGLMGNHFSKMGENSPTVPNPPPKVQEIHTKTPGGGADLSVRSSTNPNQPTAADEKKMQEILSNPETREILMDPWIQKLFEKMRFDPVSGQRFLQEADRDKQEKIQKLVNAGLLQFQR
ncbi:uncharacterized protein LOC132547893 [Ylistrum balloti]|uniref:uncharacterized protein LOC132547893 n=1 Tax=Ylistrum balloti TaxID=509963 RepID=UPI002905DE3D|nr:uncharacterized protein LOC132547893 [Ylistrum balloti]